MEGGEAMDLISAIELLNLIFTVLSIGFAIGCAIGYAIGHNDRQR